MDTKVHIRRIDDYEDPRFSPRVLRQHGCFEVNGAPYEVEIIAKDTAIVRGSDKHLYPIVIDEFRYYTPHITNFLTANKNPLKRFPPAEILQVCLAEIQPSKPYTDALQVEMLREFIREPEDIVLQVVMTQDRPIALDGHSRLMIAVEKEFDCVFAVAIDADAHLDYCVAKTREMGVTTPYDMKMLPREEYEMYWHDFCADYFEREL